MGLFSSKKGGSLFGNLLATVANKATGGILGAKRVAALQSGNIGSINPDAKEVGKTLKSITFAGEDATQSEDGTINMAKPLNEVSITAQKSGNLSRSMVNQELPIWMQRIGDYASYIGGRSTEQARVGVDSQTLLILAGAAVVVALIVSNNKR